VCQRWKGGANDGAAKIMAALKRLSRDPPRLWCVALAVRLGHAVAGSGCVSCDDGLESPTCGHSLHAKCLRDGSTHRCTAP
jgi:hypothetical protein